MTSWFTSGAHSVALAIISLLLLQGAGPQSQEAAQESALVGRIATVEPTARRVSIVPEGETDRVELILQEDGEIVLDGEELSLSDLVIHTGSRVTVRFRVANGTRVARSITVEPRPAG